MGYYVAIPCVNTKARKEMLAFMDQHFRPPSDFMDWMPQEDPMGPPTNGKDVCAYAKLNQVGWYRNAGWDEEERAYSCCLLRWMAMKVGKVLTTRDGQIPGYGPITVYYTLYEGEPVPFVIRSQCPDVPDGWDAEGYEVCDDLGWDRSMRGPPVGEDPEEDALLKESSPYLFDLRERKTKADPLIRAELERLEALWNSR